MESREEAWTQFANEIGGEFIKEKARVGPLALGTVDKLVAKVDQWTLSLFDSSYVSGSVITTYTVMEARYIDVNGFRFEVGRPFWPLLYRVGLVRKLLRMQVVAWSRRALGVRSPWRNIEIGYREFDDFVVKSNDESRVRALLGSPEVRESIAQVAGYSPGTGTLRTNRLTSEMTELRLTVPDSITDVERLRSLYVLMKVTLSQLVEIGAASDEAPPAEG